MKWENVKLGSICDILGGFAFKTENFKSEGIPLLRISNINDGKISFNENTVFIDDINTNNLERFKVKKGDILLALSGATTGKFGVYTLDIPALLNQRVALIRASNKANQRYLLYYFNVLKSQIEQISQGAAQPNISTNEIENLQIPLPPLPIQKRIVEILDAADALKRKDQALLKKYDELAQAIFIEMFGDPVRNEKGWEVIPFGKLIDYIGDIGSNGSNATISKNLEMLHEEDYAIMIRTTNLSANNFEKNMKYVSQKTYDFFSKSQVFGGEIIMNKIGSAGDFWIMPFLGKPVSLGLNQLLIRLKDLNTKYLYYYLSTEYGKSMIKASTNGAVTKSITKSAVKELPILYPDIDLQNKFSELIILIENQKNKSSLMNSTQLFNSLLQRAFKGELGE